MKNTLLWWAALPSLGLAGCGDPIGEPKCPEECPVIAICLMCDDDKCATPVVSCTPEGACGDVDWVCEDGNPPPVSPPGPAPSCNDTCAVPDICMHCDDGSCAGANVQCNPDGSCGDIEWICKE